MKTLIILAIIFLIIFIILFLIIKKLFKFKSSTGNLFGSSVFGFFKKFSERSPLLGGEDKGKKKISKEAEEKQKVIFKKTKEKRDEDKKRESKKQSSEKQDSGFKKEKLTLKGEERNGNKTLRDLGKKEKITKKSKGKGELIIRIGGFEDASNLIKNEDIRSILKYLKSKNYSIEKLLKDRKFDSKKELIKFLKEILVSFLNDEYNELKGKVSTLRKKGVDESHIELRLMSVPLKIKLFEASFHKKDFDKVINLTDSIEQELKKYN